MAYGGALCSLAALALIMTGCSAMSVRDIGLAFSSDQPIPEKHCISMNEVADPHTWNDNYLCFYQDYGVRWSTAGPIHGMLCTSIYEPCDPHTWTDNFLCTPLNTAFRFVWSANNPIQGASCINVNEVADPHCWADNYLCVV